MASAHDVAAYILESRSPLTAMKLQKLLYYSHAWHLVWDEEPLFPEPIEAWANGPVVPAVYEQHRGRFRLESWPCGNPANLLPNERETVDIVLEVYGDLGAHELSNMTHREPPWRDARAGLRPGQRSHARIEDSAIFEYYDSLYEEAEADPDGP